MKAFNTIFDGYLRLKYHLRSTTSFTIWYDQ
jgi:hypothetical protein